MQASPFLCRLTHRPTLALHQETCLSATHADPHLQPRTFKCPYQLLHSYLTSFVSPSRVSPFDRTQTYASSTCWMTYLFLWTVILSSPLLMCSSHPANDKSWATSIFLLLRSHDCTWIPPLIATRLLCFFGFLTVLLFFPLLTPIPFTCSCQINLKTLLASDSQPSDNHSLSNEKSLESLE